jgi:hypothetical protein
LARSVTGTGWANLHLLTASQFPTNFPRHLYPSSSPFSTILICLEPLQGSEFFGNGRVLTKASDLKSRYFVFKDVMVFRFALARLVGKLVRLFMLPVQPQEKDVVCWHLDLSAFAQRSA